MIAWIKNARKLIAYVVAVAGVIIASGLVPEPYVTYAVTGIAVLGALGLYATPNTPEAATQEAETEARVEDVLHQYDTAKQAVVDAYKSRSDGLTELAKLAKVLEPVAQSVKADVVPVIEAVQTAVEDEIPATPTGVNHK